MLSAIASVVGVGAAGEDEVEMAKKLDQVMSTLVDPAGTFYRFSMAHSLLQRARVNGKHA
jgi:F420-non-reducing hydrogenase small subunit